MLHLFQYVLWPFSIPYLIITYIRNILFDLKILKQTSFSIPIISVGNITVGGTGKTPHVLYLLQLLKHKNVAILSRGYKRKTKGYLLANSYSSVSEIGDEPYLIKQTCMNVHVAVAENRVEGVQKLLHDIPSIQTIILDDAFQHRAIKPGLQILLVDYNRPLWKDFVFPVGFLREGKYAIKRADIVIVSKCPADLSKNKQEIWKKKLGITKQLLFFTKVSYGNLYDADTNISYKTEQLFDEKHVLLVTGISQPLPLLKYLQTYTDDFTHLSYPDHYNYSKKDYDEILRNFNPYRTKVVTTEKDVKKLLEITRGQIPIYVIPIQIEFVTANEMEFSQLIANFVSSYKQ